MENTGAESQRIQEEMQANADLWALQKEKDEEIESVQKRLVYI